MTSASVDTRHQSAVALTLALILFHDLGDIVEDGSNLIRRCLEHGHPWMASIDGIDEGFLQCVDGIPL